MLNQKQKAIADEFLAEYNDIGISWVDYVDGELEVHFKNSNSNPWTAREFNSGTHMRNLLDRLENKIKNANKANFDEYLDWCEDGELD